MTRISPEQFRDAFLQVVSAAQADLLARWDSAGDYTSHMRDTILPALAPLLGVEVYSGEYYTLDCIYYAERDIEHFSDQATYAKCLSIALEHENNIRGSETEVNKLQLFNASLKVLIVYTDVESERARYLDRYAKIVRAADIFADFATLRRQLVIFGSRRDLMAHWHFYAYDTEGFHELQAPNQSLQRTAG